MISMPLKKILSAVIFAFTMCLTQLAHGQESNGAQQLLGQYPNGGPELTANILNSLKSDPSITGAVMALLTSANGNQGAAILSGISQALQGGNAQISGQILQNILAQYPNGGPQLSGLVQTLAITNPQLADLFLKSALTAKPQVKNSIASGLGAAVLALKSSNPQAANMIAGLVAGSGDKSLQTAYNKASGNQATAATGGQQGQQGTGATGTGTGTGGTTGATGGGATGGGTGGNVGSLSFGSSGGGNGGGGSVSPN